MKKVTTWQNMGSNTRCVNILFGGKNIRQERRKLVQTQLKIGSQSYAGDEKKLLTSKHIGQSCLETFSIHFANGKRKENVILLYSFLCFSMLQSSNI